MSEGHPAEWHDREVTMEHRYKHILQPLRVQNRVLKNRLLATKMTSQQLQGPEKFPAESTIHFYEQVAKNGASIVCCAMGTYPDKNGKHPPMSNADMTNWDVRSYFSQIADRIHAYGSLASASLQNVEPHDVGICYLDHWDEIPMKGDYSRNLENKPTIFKEQIEELIADFARQAKDFKRLGFDMVTVYMSYRGGILANALSPVLNQRNDEYGGSPENRARLPLEVFKAIKEACGSDFIIECQVSATEEEPGYTFEEFLDFADRAQEYVDIFQLRAYEGALNHGNGFNQQEHNPYMLQFAAGMKRRGIRSVISPVGTFQDLDDIERFLSEGLCDAVSMARAFICDSHYGEKLLEGRGEDVVPCLRCNTCHSARCRVNPRHGLDHVMDGMFPGQTKKSCHVAVIGGGPAGIVAALTAAQRGHQVALYEGTPELGGQLNHVDYMSFKWPIRNYRDYLRRQIENSDVELHLNCKATPELIEKGRYDAVIAACGANGTRPSCVKGVELTMLPMDALGNPEVGQKVVIVGGREVGFEVGLALAATGKEVMVLSRQKRFPCDMHTLKAIWDYMAELPHFKYLPQCSTLEMGRNFVIYEDAKGNQQRLDCDTVVFSGGRVSEIDQCMSFAGIAPQFYVIGDAQKPASVQEAVYAAYTTAMRL